MQEILTKGASRRQWSVEEKLQILAEVGVSGATVADVARRHNIGRQHIYQWRAEMRRKGFGPPDDAAFAAVEVAEVAISGGEVGSKGQYVEIGLRNGRILRIPGNAPDDVVARMIRIAEAA